MNQDRNFPSSDLASMRPLGWRLAGIFLASLLMVCLASLTAIAQDDEEEEPEIPEPEQVTLETADSVLLKCTFYPGTMGEETVPVVVLHGWEGNRLEFQDLALYLQSLGHAVIVPDLRGHGDSTTRRLPNGDRETIDGTRLNRQDFEAMVLQDMQAVKKYLMERNNDGELNIDMLTVVGSEMGAVIAVNWSWWDWHWQQLPAIRQGQDVKAIVLISPPTSFRGLTMRDTVADPRIGRDLSAMILVGGENARTASESRRLFTTMERMRDPLPEDDEERAEKQDLYYVPLETTLQGTELLNARVLDVPGLVGEFIDRRLVSREDEFGWTDRSDR